MGRTWGLLLMVTALVAGCGEPPHQDNAEADVAAQLSAPSAKGFARANGLRRFHFPRDHGPHPRYRNEWWYLTGNLHTADGRRFGFQLTIFRIALQPNPVAGTSRWRARDIYMAHAALTDVNGHRYEARQRLARGVLGLAGARSGPFRVWLQNWVWKRAADGSSATWEVHVPARGFSLDLDLRPVSPPVLQGDQGLSQKSTQPGNASYYYSIPRVATTGQITLGTRHYRVSGLSWVDREWSTSALGERQAGWDWFALQLDDGSDLMFYRLRDKDGSTDPHSSGSLVRHGTKRVLHRRDVTITPERWWNSPRGGRYPVSWRISVPSADLELTVEAALNDQEQHGLVRYWEGAVDVHGHRHNQPLKGRGYAELTGYAQ